MKKRILFIIGILILTAWGLQAQRFTSFTENPAYTIEEVKTYLETVPKERQKEADALLKRFTEFWNSPWMDDESQDIFIEVANKMLKKRMRPFPHFQSYVEAYAAFMNSPYAGELDTWSKIVQFHFNEETTLFKDKMQIYTDFFSRN